jgi:hypothetical protein
MLPMLQTRHGQDCFPRRHSGLEIHSQPRVVSAWGSTLA